MAVNVLVAALGDHPSVITGAVRALREQEGIHIQRLYVLYSQDTEASRRLNGFDLVRKSLEMACDVQGVPLPFADANTSQRSVEFLHEAVQVLKPIDDPALYNVYLLLAAGRKNMAALLALVAQFFASVRGLYTWQGAIHRSFDAFNARIGPMDFPFNYGGQFWDLGFGVNARIPGGRFAGNRLGFEWIQPISSDFNGFQIDRQGMLAATWSYQF